MHTVKTNRVILRDSAAVDGCIEGCDSEYKQPMITVQDWNGKGCILWHS